MIRALSINAALLAFPPTTLTRSLHYHSLSAATHDLHRITRAASIPQSLIPTTARITFFFFSTSSLWDSSAHARGEEI